MSRIKHIISAALCSTILVPAAYAQDNAERSSAPQSAEVDPNIIIVTATRRAQDVQDIPLAVTAVTPAQLERQGVVDVQQITQVSPSFSASNAQTSSGTVVLRIRGVGTTSNNIGFESAVGIFVDGAYQSRPGIALSELVDVERVEVLRGPQGTLFGRNTSAGALNITNKRPDLNEFGGFANASYGNFDHISLQGAVNAPIIQDTLALRVTGAYRKRDGFVGVVDSAGNNIGDSNGADQYLVRGQLGFESDGGIKARLIGDYSKSKAGCCAAIEIRKTPLEPAGLFAAVGLGPRGGMAGVGGAFDTNNTTAVQTAVDSRFGTANFAPLADVDQWGITGEIEVPIGEDITATYIGSYRQYRSLETYDSDFSGLDVFNANNDKKSIDTMTHELRFQGEAFDGKLDWLVGGYYSDEDIYQSIDFALGTDYDRLAGALLAGATAGGTLNPLSPLYAGGATFLGATPLQNLTGINPALIRTTNAYSQKSESWSLFTHNTFEVTDGLKLTMGLRYSDEKKNGGFTQVSTNNNLCPAALGQVGAGNTPPSVALNTAILGLSCFGFTAPAIGSDLIPFPIPRPYQASFSDKELIYTGKVSYEFEAPVTVYASYTHGFKSGGINLDATAASGGRNPVFQSEEVNAYEFGLKAKMLDNALTFNMALFLEKFTNFQVLEFTGAQFETFNVPKAETKGFELEMTARPSDNFTINAGLTYADAKYPNDCATPADELRVRNLCGHSLTNAPKFVAIMGATYTRDIGSSLDFFVNGQIRAESDRRTSTQAFLVPTPPATVGSTAANPFDVQDGNVKINMRAGIGDQNDAWGVEAWVTNLTNQVTRGITFNTVLRGSGAASSRSAFIQAPRMYGVTVRGAF